MAFRDDRSAEFTPQLDKALIATRTYRVADVLVIKFAFQEISGTDVSLFGPVYAA